MNDQIEQYVAVVSPALVALTTLIGVLVLLCIGSQRRVPAVLVFAPFWLTLGQLLNLPISPLAKVTSSLPALLLITASILSRRRVQLNAALLVLVICAIWAMLCILTTMNANLALVIQGGWLVTALAVVAVSGMIRSVRDTVEVIRCLSIGLGLAIALVFFEFLVNSDSALRGGRVHIAGSNPNTIAPVFLAAFALNVMSFREAWSRRWAAAHIAVAATAFGFVLLSGSRAVLAGVLVAAIPLVLWATRRPGRALLAVAALVGASVWLLSSAASNPLQRLTSLSESGRLEIAGEYIGNSTDRVGTGLFLTEGMSFTSDPSVGWTPHNSFLLIYYIGGVVLLIPMVSLMVLAAGRLRSAVRRQATPGSRDLARAVLYFLTASWIVALTNGTLFYPTSAWAFVHLTLAAAALRSAAYDPERGRSSDQRGPTECNGALTQQNPGAALRAGGPRVRHGRSR